MWSNMSIAFVDGTVIVGDGRLIEHATVLVENDRISRIAPNSPKLPGDVVRIPMEGRTLLPGFIDCHVHLCLDGSADPVTSCLRESPTTTDLKGGNFVRQTLLVSATNGRDMGTEHWVACHLCQFEL
jgi:imidazolonepropionase-like amidohydrolase